MAIIAASDYKTWAGITVTTYDARITALIAQLQARVENYCRRAFDYSASAAETIDGSGADTFQVRRAPIASIASIVVTYDGGATTTTLDSSNYQFETDDSGLVSLVGSVVSRIGLDNNGFPADPSVGYTPRWGAYRRSITITYAGGYGGAGSNAYPADLQLSFMEYLSESLAISGNAGGPLTAGAMQGVLKSKTLGRNSETYRDPAERAARLQELFYPYRRPVFGA